MTQTRYALLGLLFSVSFIQTEAAEVEEFPVFTNEWVLDTKAAVNMQGSIALSEWMDERQYRLPATGNDDKVPPLYAINLPPDLASQTVAIKTSVFVRLLLPSVLQVNAIISEQRELLVTLDKSSKAGTLTSAQEEWVQQLSNHYGLTEVNINELLLRVDTVPTELALAQGVDESGWGTSHFAIAGNALFGQHASAHGNGKFITTPGGHVKVAAFDSTYAAVASYIHNLNSTHAYHGLRELRGQLRQADELVTGEELAGTLLFYSERGEDYVNDLRNIIRHRHLNNLDNLTLKSSTMTVVRF